MAFGGPREGMAVGGLGMRLKFLLTFPDHLLAHAIGEKPFFPCGTGLSNAAKQADVEDHGRGTHVVNPNLEVKIVGFFWACQADNWLKAVES